ncbi:MAG: hypothetical protein H6Q33_5447 [Deltaproteobacteria bacterium]|nr:hypothetical protein [Deltaproteobacteria bacterium]
MCTTSTVYAHSIWADTQVRPYRWIGDHDETEIFQTELIWQPWEANRS